MQIEKIVAEVKSRLGQTQISDKTIETLALLSYLAEGTEPDDAYFDKIKKACESVQGNVNSVVSKAVEDYKSAHKTPTPGPKPNEPKPVEPNDELKAVLERLEALENGRKAESQKASIEALRNEVLSKADELKVSNKNLWKDVIGTLEIVSDSKAEDILTSAKGVYEAKLKSYIGEGALPYGKTEGGSGEEVKTHLDEFFAQKKAEGKF